MAIKKRKLGSYPFASVIFSITLSLFICGIFGFFLLYGYKLMQQVKNDFRIIVYLKKHATENDVNILRTKLSSKPYILQANKGNIQFVSKKEVAASVFSESKESYKGILNDNPYRDYIVFSVNEKYFNPEKIQGIERDLVTDSTVFEISYPKDIVGTVSKNFKKIGVLFAVIISVLLLITFLLISNAIRLALYSQRFLVRSMQLVGAMPWFIRRPFIYRAVFHGILSGIMASVVLYFGNVFASQQIPAIASVDIRLESFALLGILTVFGAIVGLISSIAAINRYLKMSLDDLY